MANDHGWSTVVNPDEVEPYKKFYSQVKNNIKAHYPDMMVGTVFAYHEFDVGDSWFVYHNLSIGDFDAFTLYIYSEGFRVSVTMLKVHFAVGEAFEKRA